MYDYIPESELSYQQLEAGLQNGYLEPWNVDATTGEQWFRCLKAIHGVPSTEAMHADVDEYDADEDRDDVVWLGSEDGDDD